MECKDAALKLLSFSDKTVSEVEKRLVSLGYPEDEIEETLEFLKEFHYLDDFEYCLKYMRFALIGKRRGVLGTNKKLKEKGITEDIIQDALHEFIEQEGLLLEKERASRVAEKLCAGRNIDDKLLSKTARKLISMGYEKDAVYDAIGRLMNQKRVEFNE
ncbi:MAG: regulatory protein RecX [Eubacteriales bacterium]|nr:regulatory protein RecX [Eubacteriales bacterium]MDD4390022.1 regulatory protein RecX [Eubacteriales bacterium]